MSLDQIRVSGPLWASRVARQQGKYAQLELFFSFFSLMGLGDAFGPTLLFFIWERGFKGHFKKILSTYLLFKAIQDKLTSDSLNFNQLHAILMLPLYSDG